MEERAITEPLKLPHESLILWERMEPFERHGCVIRRDVGNVFLTVPAGTVRQLILPRTLEERSWIIFPDGWRVWESLRRDGVSLIALPVDRALEASSLD